MLMMCPTWRENSTKVINKFKRPGEKKLVLRGPILKNPHGVVVSQSVGQQQVRVGVTFRDATPYRLRSIMGRGYNYHIQMNNGKNRLKIKYRVFIKYCVSFENFKIYSGLWLLSLPALCTRTTKWQVCRTPALQQNWQSSEKSQHYKEKTKYLMKTL